MHQIGGLPSLSFLGRGGLARLAWIAAMQSSSLCRHTHTHTLWDSKSAHAHTHTDNENEHVNWLFSPSVSPPSPSLCQSVRSSLIHCVHKWFILCVGYLLVACLTDWHPSIWSCRVVLRPLQHLLRVSMFPCGAVADAQPAVPLPRSHSRLSSYGWMDLSVSPLISPCVCLSEKICSLERTVPTQPTNSTATPPPPAQ